MTNTRKTRLSLLALALAGAIALTLLYWNHFDNTFHFDDVHTIVENSFIADISNLPRFFVDSSTLSSLPTNQSYRPVIACLNAIDYWIGGGLDPTIFHLHIFLEFLVLLGLIFWFFLTIFKAASGANHPFVALFGTAFFAFHTATAETLNYIIARSDGFSTLMVLAGVLLFVKNDGWKRQLGLVPFIIGSFAKPTTLMLAPLLALYFLMVHSPSVTVRQENADFLAKMRGVVGSTIAYFAIGTAFYVFARSMASDAWTPGGSSVSQYLNTQPYVLWVYVKTFFLPTGLTADTDLKLIQDYFAPRVLWGLFVISLLLAAAWFSSRRRTTLPISYGILWFFICLIPTSTIIPLAEVMNHHRTFFPYIGLTMAVTWGGFLLFQKLAGDVPSVPAKTGVTALVMAILALHAYGVYQRNEVWHSGETLWLDVTVKSPDNGRGLMNYGLARMSAGDIDAALDYFNRARNTSYRNHPYLFVNLGIATNALADRSGDAGLSSKAEEYFKTAVRLGPEYPATHQRYADWLHRKGRSDEAISHAKKAVELAPALQSARVLLQRIEFAMNSDISAAEKYADSIHSDEAYVNLSLQYHRLGSFEKSILAAEKALQLNPDYAIAYNNICSANNQLMRYEDAIRACERALAIQPDFSRAQNNLARAKDGLKTTELNSELQQSFDYFNAGNYSESLATARRLVELDPEFVAAWNNICASHNALADWDSAIPACERALELDPDFKLAVGNLAWARKNQAAD